VSSTKQAEAKVVRNPNTIRWRNGEKKPWKKPGSVRGPVLLCPNEKNKINSCDHDSRLHDKSDCRL